MSGRVWCDVTGRKRQLWSLRAGDRRCGNRINHSGRAATANSQSTCCGSSSESRKEERERYTTVIVNERLDERTGRNTLWRMWRLYCAGLGDASFYTILNAIRRPASLFPPHPFQIAYRRTTSVRDLYSNHL